MASAVGAAVKSGKVGSLSIYTLPIHPKQKKTSELEMLLSPHRDAPVLKAPF